MSHPTIGYKNDSGEVIPAHAVLQFKDDVEDIDSGISVLVTKPDGDGEHFAIDDGKGATIDDEGGKYGQCIKAFIGVFWVHYVADAPPDEAWVTEVGPVDDEWHIGTEGTGFVYAGLHEPDNQRILVMQMAGGGGNFIEGRLTSAMTPASNSLTGATTFTFRRFVVLDGSVTPKILEERDEDETGVNRDTTLSADVDAYCHFKRIQGEWRPSPVSDICST